MDPTAGLRQSRLDELIAGFRGQGCRLTWQRLAVLCIPGTSAEHPSAQHTHHQVKLTLPTIGLGTLYPTIGLLQQMGEVMLWALPYGGSRCDGRYPQPQPHLFCDKCGPIVDVGIPSVGDLTFALDRQRGHRIVSHRLDFSSVPFLLR